MAMNPSPGMMRSRWRCIPSSTMSAVHHGPQWASDGMQLGLTRRAARSRDPRDVLAEQRGRTVRAGWGAAAQSCSIHWPPCCREKVFGLLSLWVKKRGMIRPDAADLAKLAADWGARGFARARRLDQAGQLGQAGWWSVLHSGRFLGCPELPAKRLHHDDDRRHSQLAPQQLQLPPTMAKDSSETPRRAFPTLRSPKKHNRLTMTDGSGDARGNARGQSPAGLPRQLRPPPDSPQPLPHRHLLDAVEVHGTDPSSPCPTQPSSTSGRADEQERRSRGAETKGGAAKASLSPPASLPPSSSIDHRGKQTDRLADTPPPRRTSDTATKSASTSSSRSAWPRWTSSGRARAVPAATEPTKTDKLRRQGRDQGGPWGRTDGRAPACTYVCGGGSGWRLRMG